MEDWHSRSLDEITTQFGVDITRGLVYEQVQQGYSKYGHNEFEEEEEDPLYWKVIEAFKDNYMLLLLLGSAFISLVIGNIEDAFSIGLAIVIVFTVGFIQEYKSEQSINELKKLAPPYCKVLRLGKLQTLLAREIVPGDIIQLETGDRVPADLRIVKCVNMEVDESSFTGENEPVIKKDDIVLPLNTNLNERCNMLFMGTMVTSGNGQGIVINNAKNSQFGKVVEMMQDMTQRKTPLQESMDQLGHQLSVLSLGIIALIFIIGLIQGRPLLEMFNISVSLAVAAIPEGLPVVVMVTLALGVLRMSKHKVIIKKMACIESLSCIDLLCMDKTGTLTLNQLTCLELYLIENECLLDLRKVNNLDWDNNIAFQHFLNIACLCNNASISIDGKVLGQSSDSALLKFFLSLGYEDKRKNMTKLKETPFHSNHKYMSVSYEKDLTYFKGAFEVTVDKCKYYYDKGTHAINQNIKEHLKNQFDLMAKKGLRVLALAYGKDENNLILLGLLGLSDPPRLDLISTMDNLIKAGIKIVMITGDSEQTARSIGEQINLPLNPNLKDNMTGNEMDIMEQNLFEEHIDSITIFSRTNPYHKMRIIQSYQNKGYRVGMTGDGVNDAPALKLADVGIAMAKHGTDVAKESSDMLILEDDLNVLLLAIKEGKTIYRNIQSFITFQLSTSLATLTLISLATLLGLPNPLNAMQILWINILMDGPPAQSLGVEPSKSDALYCYPRKKDSPIITKAILSRILINAGVIIIGTLFIYIKELNDGEVTRRDTTMTFTAFVLFDLFNALNCRDLNTPLLFNKDTKTTTNKMFWLAILFSILGQLAVIYLPFFQSIFQTEAISIIDLLFLVAFCSSLFFIIEGIKFFNLFYFKNRDMSSKLV